MTVDEARSRIKQCERDINKEIDELRSAARGVGTAAESAAEDLIKAAKASSRGHRARMILIPLGITLALTFILWKAEHEVIGSLLCVGGIALTIKLGSIAGSSGSKIVSDAIRDCDTVKNRRQNLNNAIDPSRNPNNNH